MSVTESRLLFLKVKLVIICTAVPVTTHDGIKGKEQILILTLCSLQHRSSARLAPQPWWQQGGFRSSLLVFVNCNETGSHGCRRERSEECNLSKTQQFCGRKKPKPTSETRNYYSTGLFCASQEITSNCTKPFTSREVIQKSSLLPNFPNLKSHS